MERVPLRGGGATTANKEWRNEWGRKGTNGEDAFIQWFQRSSLLPCLNLPVVVKSWKCNAATTNKSSSLTRIEYAAGKQKTRQSSFSPHHTSAFQYLPFIPICTYIFLHFAITDRHELASQEGKCHNNFRLVIQIRFPTNQSKDSRHGMCWRR